MQSLLVLRYPARVTFYEIDFNNTNDTWLQSVWFESLDCLADAITRRQSPGEHVENRI